MYLVLLFERIKWNLVLIWKLLVVCYIIYNLYFPSNLPKIYQAFLMSATLSEDVRALKRMVLHNAVSVMENTRE